jgi:hypothetical protein
MMIREPLQDEPMGIEVPESASATREISRSLRHRSIPGAAKSGATLPESAERDRDLATVIEALPTLPEVIRTGFLAMIRAAGWR